MRMVEKLDTDALNPDSLRHALRVWDRLKELGAQPLAHLRAVEAQRCLAGYSDTPSGRGLALREVLQYAIEELKPDNGNNVPAHREITQEAATHT